MRNNSPPLAEAEPTVPAVVEVELEPPLEPELPAFPDSCVPPIGVEEAPAVPPLAPTSAPTSKFLAVITPLNGARTYS